MDRSRQEGLQSISILFISWMKTVSLWRKKLTAYTVNR
jgi:hypothetical protein